MYKWLNNPRHFRRGFWIFLLFSVVLNSIILERERDLYILYIFCVILLGLGYYQKRLWFLLSLTLLVVTSRYYLIPDSPPAFSIFLIHNLTYFLITLMASGFMKYVQKLSEDHLELTIALANALDSRDAYTRNHSENVAKYSVEIAKKMNLPQDQLNFIQVGGLLHDIGKIGIPEHILLKPGKLTEEEYELIKSHPSIGIEMIEHVKIYKISGVLDIVQSHHERYDGRGYPNKLKGEQIPLMARIVSVADAYDAMISRRVYKHEMDLDYALNEIRKNKGTQFDPDVVDAFLSLFAERDECEMNFPHKKTS